jgi:transcriptional regulator with XRE-family HTH domain
MRTRCATFGPRTRGAFILGASPPPTIAAQEARRAELGEFLRARRGEVQPAEVGLTAGERRRTPGLRREEVAQLAGVSVSWYTWLEQGRDMRASAEVLDAIARVLRLDAAERAHLFHLARAELPLPGPDYPRQAPAELAALVMALLPHPAHLMGPRADLLAWNDAFAELVVDFGAMEPRRRNMLWWLFTECLPADRIWEPTAKRTLARFRAEHARYAGHPEFGALVEDLERESPDFRAWWPDHEVLAEQSGTKEIVSGAFGALRFHHLQSAPTSHPELRLTIYAPADAGTRAALAERFA